MSGISGRAVYGRMKQRALQSTGRKVPSFTSCMVLWYDREEHRKAPKYLPEREAATGILGECIECWFYMQFLFMFGKWGEKR